jgi:hypothetical protein
MPYFTTDAHIANASCNFPQLAADFSTAPFRFPIAARTVLASPTAS